MPSFDEFVTVFYLLCNTVKCTGYSAAFVIFILMVVDCCALTCQLLMCFPRVDSGGGAVGVPRQQSHHRSGLANLSSVGAVP